MSDEQFRDAAVDVMGLLQELKQEEDLSAADALMVLHLITGRQCLDALSRIESRLHSIDIEIAGFSGPT